VRLASSVWCPIVWDAEESQAMGDLQPITREFLREFYKAYPIEPLDPETAALEADLKSRSHSVLKKANLSTEVLRDHAFDDAPKRMDHNMYFHRWQCEEIEDAANALLKCGSVRAGSKEATKINEIVLVASETGAAYAQFQETQREHVSKLIAQFLPNDFRVTLLNKRRESKEVAYKSQIDALIAGGGSIKQKYDLLWEQQFDRRKGLADLGAATGIYRAVIKFLAGCPEVLLDFAKQINAPLGPTEEMRILYGPNLYQLTRIANQLHLFFRAVLHAEKAGQGGDLSSHLQFTLESTTKYYKSSKEYLDFMTVIVESSPMFVSAETLAKSAAAQESGEIVAFTEASVGARDALKVPVEVPAEALASAKNIFIYYEVSANKDIKFGLERRDGSWLRKLDAACARGAHEMGRTKVDCTSFSLVFDNKYSRMTRKTVQYRYALVVDNEKIPKWAQELIDAGYM